MSSYKPLTHPDYVFGKDTQELLSLGSAYVEKGQIATLILAGGVGSRLGFDAPKALVEITERDGKKKTLLEALLTQCPKKSVVAIMGSKQNIETITTYANALNKALGLDLTLFFFCQKSWPYLDDEGQEIRQASGEVALGPRGNGEALEVLEQAHFFDKLADLGIESLSIVPIDNPKANPFDLELIGAFIKGKSEVAILTVKKEPHESAGVLAIDEKRQVGILEYTELSHSESEKFCFANTGIYVLDLSFCKRAACMKRALKSQKKEAVIDGVKRSVIKQETYLFDTFAYAKGVTTFEASRQKRFMPIKIPEDLLAFS